MVFLWEETGVPGEEPAVVLNHSAIFHIGCIWYLQYTRFITINHGRKKDKIEGHC